MLKNAIRKACDYNQTLTQEEYDELLKWAKISGSTGREACDAIATALAMDGRSFRYVRHREGEEKTYGQLGQSRTSSGCFLTTACMQVMENDFSDDCTELSKLRMFRDSYLESNYLTEVEDYYHLAPKVVREINLQENYCSIYQELYHDMVIPAVNLIDRGLEEEAYELYKTYCLKLQKEYLN